MLRLLATVTIIVVTATLAAPQPMSDCAIHAEITPVKLSYLHQEPIEFQLKLLNSGSGDSLIDADESLFGGHLSFTDPTGTLKRRTEYIDEPTRMTQRITLIRKLTPGESMSIPIFLQSYFESPPPGVYKLNYSLEIECEGRQQTSTSQGVVSFAVSGADEERLKQIISNYSHQLDSNDFSQRSRAAEALTGMDSPLIIPELKKLMVLGDSRMAFQALARFKGNEEAKQLVDTAIHSESILETISALEVLSKWKLAISKSDIQQFLASPDKSLRLATLHYLESLSDSGNLPLINRLVDDPDPYISAEAKRIKKLLKHSSK